MTTLPRKQFFEALKVVGPAVKAGDLRYTGRVRLTGNGDVLAQGFNGDLAISAAIEAAAIFPTVVVPYEPLARFVNTAGDDITIVFENKDVEFKAGGASVKLRTMAADDLPRIIDADADPVELDPDTLAALAGILYAASTDGARPILTGLGLIDGWAVCTDSYRLAAIRLDAGVGNRIIPADTVRQVAKHAADGISLAVDNLRVTFRAGNVTWTSRLIEGQFPNWQRLVGNPTGQLHAEKQALLDGLEQVDLFGSEWVRVEPTAGAIGLGTRATEGDTAGAIVDGKVTEGVSFTLRYLVDMVKALPGDDITIGLEGASKPALVGSLEAGAIHLLMPVRQS